MSGRWLYNEPLAKYTTWRVGGPAEKMFFPDDKQDLVGFMQSAHPNEPLFWLGMGSNLLVRDGGIQGIVINTRSRLKQMLKTDQRTIYVEAGVPCVHVARFCAQSGFSGAEFLAGIPGTMGGALKMNAGAFGAETWDIVKSVEVIDSDGRVLERGRSDFNIAYRSVRTDRHEWFLAAELFLSEGEYDESMRKIKNFLEQRQRTQPTNKHTCGSVFKNPPGDYAARLIEASGLKGYCIGGACVSQKHANFIENQGTATAWDIEKLIMDIQQQVFLKQGVQLQTEVCFAGDEA
jgi:UDP-N-acetylmuramate dehydrogenase